MSVPSVRSRILAPGDSSGWLTPLPGHWIDAARARLSHHTALVRVTVTALRGSTPREAGASMLVDPVGTIGTIGGGHLEWHATSLARELLRDSRTAPVRIADLTLGIELGQCCGGRVELWLERLTRNDLPWLEEAARRMRTERGLTLASETTDGVVTHRLVRHGFAGSAAVAIERPAPGRITLFEMSRPRRPDLWIFGAGHVGQALVRLLAELALFEITWVDSRAALLPILLPEGVTSEVCATPVKLVAAGPAGTRFVVMTHDHALDYELCRAILGRTDACWLGLIGSASKATRFRSRLSREGLSRETVSRLNCPIGVPGISSKLPGAIAVAIAAQLLQQAAPKPAGAPEPAASDVADCAGDCGACASHPHGKT
jgi:xanthine dehydrogenase accessory factor